MKPVILKSLTAAFLFLFLPAIHAETKLPSATRFIVGGHNAFVMEAKVPANEKPWVWYAPTLQNYPNNRLAWYFGYLMDKGISIAGIDLGEVRGSPASNLKFSTFYDEMVRRGFSRQPILLGQSRGGLMLLSWATVNPDKLTAFVGIYPVCNLASWPLKYSKPAVLQDYAIPEAELIANLNTFNPVDNLRGLLENKVPLFIIHGNADEVVPYEENSKLIRDRYNRGGGKITVKIVDGGKHEETNAFFECQELLDFIFQQGIKGQHRKISSDQKKKKESAPEPEDPDKHDQSAWNNIKPGIHSGFGSTDVAWSKNSPPAGEVSDEVRLQGWKGERVNCLLLVWSSGKYTGTISRQSASGTVNHTITLEVLEKKLSPPAESIYESWVASAMGFDGFLRWAYNNWAENPETDSRFIRWPSGDTYFVYPFAQSSIRFERLREGIQDFEKIRILKNELDENPSGEAAAAKERLNNFLNSIHTNTLDKRSAADVINEGKQLLYEIVKIL